MTRIDTANQLATLIREQLSTQKLNPRNPAAATGSVRQGSIRPSKPQKKSVDDLITQRIRAIDAHDPDQRRKVLRIFLESILLAELGDELINDPAFYRMVDEVQATIEHNEALQPLIQRAINLLLAENSHKEENLATKVDPSVQTTIGRV